MGHRNGKEIECAGKNWSNLIENGKAYHHRPERNGSIYDCGGFAGYLVHLLAFRILSGSVVSTSLSLDLSLLKYFFSDFTKTTVNMFCSSCVFLSLS